MFAVLKIDDRLRLITNNYAQNKAKILANSVINQTVSDYLNENEIEYSDLIKINSTKEGRVTSVEFDTVELTKIKSGIISHVQNNISKQTKNQNHKAHYILAKTAAHIEYSGYGNNK